MASLVHSITISHPLHSPGMNMCHVLWAMAFDSLWLAFSIDNETSLLSGNLLFSFSGYHTWHAKRKHQWKTCCILHQPMGLTLNIYWYQCIIKWGLKNSLYIMFSCFVFPIYLYLANLKLHTLIIVILPYRIGKTLFIMQGKLCMQVNDKVRWVTHPPYLCMYPKSIYSK